MYHLIGQLNPSNNHAVQPFPQPATGATITFWQGQPMILYHACLVEVSSLSGHTLSFYGVNVANEATDTSKLHTVDLRDTAAVWPSGPSSKWEEVTSTNKFLVLLLSTKLIDGDPTLEAARAEDGGKWPRGSSDKMLKLQDELKMLVDRLRILRNSMNQKSQQDIDSLFGDYLR